MSIIFDSFYSRLPLNLCVVSEYSCIVEDFRKMVKSYEEETKKFISEYEIAEINEHKTSMFMNVTDMEALQKLMTSTKMKEWDKANNCLDVVYSLEKVS